MSMPTGSTAIQDAGADAPGVRRILVPLDGSRHAATALPYALALATATAAHINLLAIVEPLHLHDGLPSDTGREDDERRVDVNAAYLESVAARVRTRGLTVETAVRHGDRASGIVAASAEDGGALVVMGTHGRTGLALCGLLAPSGPFL